ncbi:MAG: GNAT family protein [Candidatus Limnocylindrales bacterium]
MTGARRRLTGARVTLRAPLTTDVEALAAIQAEPGVVRWWPPDTAEELHDMLFQPEADVVPWIIEHEGRVVGYVQDWEETDPLYRHAGIDLFLTTSAQGQGLGPDAIRTLAAHLIDDRGHHRLTIDPVATNERAIRAYARVGFRPVGRLRAYQRTSDGGWEDGLLMEMLADELVRDA